MDEVYQDLLIALEKLKHVRTREELEVVQAEIKIKQERALQKSEEYRMMINEKEIKAMKRAKQLQSEISSQVIQAKRDAFFHVSKKRNRMYARSVSPTQLRDRMNDIMRMIA